MTAKAKIEDKAKLDKQLINEMNALKERTAEIEESEANPRRLKKLMVDTNNRLQDVAQRLFVAKQDVEKKTKELEKAQETLELQIEERTTELTAANEQLKREIREHENTNRALRAAEANLRKVIVTNPDGVVIINREGIVQFVNPAAESLFARKAEELVGELFGFPVMRSEVIELDIVNHGGGPGTAEMRVVETEWNGQNAYLALLRDITHRKLADEKIKQAAQEWRTTFDSITDMVSIHDRNFKILRVNKALAGAFNKEPKELIGKTCYELFHDTKQPCPNCPHMRSLKTQKPATLEIFEARLGIHLGVSTSPILSENGEVKSSVHIAKDITDRIKASKALQESEERFRLLAETLPIGVFRANHDGMLTYTNRTWRKMFGVSLAESLKMNLRQFFHPDVRETTWAEWSVAMHNLSHFSRELPILDAGGTVRWAQLSSASLLDDNGTHYTGTIIDITEHKRAEETLKEANEKLTEYDQLKDEFVSTASHELRTPLSIIMGAIRLILDEIPGKIVEEQREILAMAMENVKRLGRIIDSLLNISRIESGKLDLQKRIVNISELIKDTVSNFESIARENDIQLECDVPREKVDICLDPDKTQEILTNLISNSLKFTPKEGWIKVTCAKRDGEVLISVQDSGVGIAKKDIPSLFDKFTQFGRKAGPGEKGTGLGLAIVKKLVEMHGGKIEAESEVDQGTTFTISLPLASEEVVDGLPVETDELVEHTLSNN